MKCDDVKKYLHNFIDGELGGDALRGVEEHLAKCPECMKEFKSLKGAILMLKGLDEIDAPPDIIVNVNRMLDEVSILEKIRGFFTNPKLFKIRFSALATVIAILFVIVMNYRNPPSMDKLKSATLEKHYDMLDQKKTKAVNDEALKEEVLSRNLKDELKEQALENKEEKQVKKDEFQIPAMFDKELAGKKRAETKKQEAVQKEKVAKMPAPKKVAKPKPVIALQESTPAQKGDAGIIDKRESVTTTELQSVSGDERQIEPEDDSVRVETSRNNIAMDDAVDLVAPMEEPVSTQEKASKPLYEEPPQVSDKIEKMPESQLSYRTHEEIRTEAAPSLEPAVEVEEHEETAPKNEQSGIGGSQMQMGRVMRKRPKLHAAGEREAGNKSIGMEMPAKLSERKGADLDVGGYAVEQEKNDVRTKDEYRDGNAKMKSWAKSEAASELNAVRYMNYYEFIVDDLDSAIRLLDEISGVLNVNIISKDHRKNMIIIRVMVCENKYSEYLKKISDLQKLAKAEQRDLIINEKEREEMSKITKKESCKLITVEIILSL